MRLRASSDICRRLGEAFDKGLFLRDIPSWCPISAIASLIFASRASYPINAALKSSGLSMSQAYQQGRGNTIYPNGSYGYRPRADRPIWRLPSRSYRGLLHPRRLQGKLSRGFFAQPVHRFLIAFCKSFRGTFRLYPSDPVLRRAVAAIRARTPFLLLLGRDQPLARHDHLIKLGRGYHARKTNIWPGGMRSNQIPQFELYGLSNGGNRSQRRYTYRQLCG